ncbi:hypothetical protein B7Y92_03970 [Candidatus Saccharibacteria bacterium 32-50-13]|nr:MAG: hypothetical protein B7Y92_03970 [Candidatus Saccharibacteria bacterium 32-50-13]
MTTKLLCPEDYISDATQLAKQATNRISLLSFIVADHPATHDLINSLIDASKRGVDVSVQADIYTYGEVNGSLLPIRYFNKASRAATTMARRLRSAGVNFHWLGHGRVTLFNGRTHSKWLVIDNTVYSFGGVNIYQEGVENTDYMLKLTDETLANTLVTEQKRIFAAEKNYHNYPSHQKKFKFGTVMFDGGFTGGSIIYRRVCELAEQAESIVFVSQYCPTGRLARILKKKKAAVYYNRPEQASFINRLLIWASIGLSQLPTLYSRDKYQHSKYIIMRFSDHTRVAITGSHNFAYAGVVSGTREIALETTDDQIIDQLEKFSNDYIY